MYPTPTHNDHDCLPLRPYTCRAAARADDRSVTLPPQNINSRQPRPPGDKTLYPVSFSEASFCTRDGGRIRFVPEIFSATFWQPRGLLQQDLAPLPHSDSLPRGPKHTSSKQKWALPKAMRHPQWFVEYILTNSFTLLSSIFSIMNLLFVFDTVHSRRIILNTSLFNHNVPHDCNTNVFSESTPKSSNIITCA